RGVTWGEVDLRWGVTDEQKAEGQVLPICLEEIRRCRPYFIGLLGERYGWIPNEISQELIEREPWLAEHREHSVTELEILHGVLNDPKMADHAFFYFRNPAFIDSLPAKQQSAFREMPTEDEIKTHGADEATKRAKERKHKLAALKERIRKSGLPVREDYPDPRALGELVLQDLTDVINRLYPEGTQPDPLDRDAADHDAFAQSRARTYIGRQDYFDALDAHARGDDPPLVILGESGSGKSALLANWAGQYRDAHQDVLLLMHFIGATPDSTDWAAMLRRIMGEFKRRLGVQGDIPDQPDALRAAFANWLSMAAAKGRVVLILDGLNQLEDRDQAPDLVWLPPATPANIRLILSTLPGRPLDDLNKRGWRTLEVQPLGPDERKRLIAEYLAQYTKALSAARVDRIAVAKQTANPLYLRTLLEELRVFGAHERLDERIGYYLAADTVQGLYEKVLERYEEDYERERPGLVREAMSLQWAARRGLAETELLELLGSEGQPLPRAIWSPLYLAAEPSLVNRSGLIGFFHDYFRQAICNRYLLTEQAQQEAHVRLADYFDGRELGARKVDEEPWQLAQAKAWERLYTLLTDLQFFNAAWQIDVSDTRGYWAQIESNSPLRKVIGYQRVLNAPGQFDYEVVHRIGLLLMRGNPEEATGVFESLVDRSRRAGDRAYLSTALGDLAQTLMQRGVHEGVIDLLKEQDGICREQGNKEGLAVSLMGQGDFIHRQGDLDGAIALYAEGGRLCRELGNKALLQESLGHQAVILLDCGDLDKAMALLGEQELLCRELGNKAGLASSFVEQARVLSLEGDLDISGELALLKDAEHIFRELGYKYDLAWALGNQARTLGLCSVPELALPPLWEAYEICDSCGYTELREKIENYHFSIMPTIIQRSPVSQPKRPFLVSVMCLGFWLCAALLGLLTL
ncbi:MAG: NACHT domain-containing protein, partial [Chloroflexota bacterium]|nr:NACHT domain-containing protein [Chloroflexota bacterium]